MKCIGLLGSLLTSFSATEVTHPQTQPPETCDIKFLRYGGPFNVAGGGGRLKSLVNFRTSILGHVSGPVTFDLKQIELQNFQDLFISQLASNICNHNNNVAESLCPR